MTYPHLMLELPFPTEHGLAWVRVPVEGITRADADRMAEMVKTVVVEDLSGGGVASCSGLVAKSSKSSIGRALARQEDE